MAKIEELHERIDFLEDVVEKQKNLMYHYERSLQNKSRIRELDQTDKKLDQTDKKLEIDKAYLDHLKETQNIVIMRKSERGWSKYE